MVKTDGHMEKIRKHLLEKQLSMKRAEDAKKQRYMKKFGKKVQQAKLEEYAHKKKTELEKIKKLRGKSFSEKDRVFIMFSSRYRL
jgi:rRNA-processing protein EBP2